MAEHYKGHRIGSRKATVRREFDEKGQDAALALGKELGLAAGTIKSWMGGWRKGEVTPTLAINPRAIGPRKRVNITTGKRAIILQGHPECQGVVLEEGPEQSLVRWRNGNTVIACNSWLEDDPNVETPL